MLEDTIYESLEYAFESMNSTIEKIIDIVSMSPYDFSGVATSLANNISNAVVPIALVLVSLFFVIEFCNKTMMFEVTRAEAIVKLMLKFILAKVIVQASFGITMSIFTFTVDILNKIGSVGVSFASIDLEPIKENVKNLNIIEQIVFYISIMPFSLGMIISKWIALLIVYGRIFEIYVYMAISPIPLSTVSAEGFQDIAKRFIQNYAGVCLQGAVILLICSVYSAIAVDHFIIEDSDSVWVNLATMTFYTIVFVTVICKTSSWSKRLVGLI